MNEGTKTGIFWVVAVAMLVVSIVVAWPTRSNDTEGGIFPGTLLFEEFKDPLAVASMKITTFNEERGQLADFVVSKDSESGLWTIPSRDGYPADALIQMREAANSLIGLKILDVQTSNAEDHDDLGVAEPQNLKVGDEGVGRMVVLKDASQETLASLIIGDALKDDPQKRYVRIPGQDPVYVVKLDESPLTTRFQDWIEDDLLQISSIDIAEIEIKDYTAAVSGNQVARARNYDATVKLDGPEWRIASLVKYDPKNSMAEPTPVEFGEDQKPNKPKLDALKNALDDLRIADVVRKPDGMSANLRANQSLLSDEQAVASLGQRGFYPIPLGPKGELELLSANGELNVVLGDGVKYAMRFGNIAGVSDAGEVQSSQDVAGVNRYLLVTTMVDQSMFPPPDLKPVPQTLEELDAILNPKQDAEPKEPADQPESEEASSEEGGETADQGEADASDANEEPEASQTDEARREQDEEESGGDEPAEQTAEDEQLTDEEKQELLEAEQEKITKENQRKLDARKDRLELAERRVRDLNARFADWYYVIPEDTYAKLRIEQDELFEQPPAAAAAPLSPLQSGPQIQIPGVPGQN